MRSVLLAPLLLLLAALIAASRLIPGLWPCGDCDSAQDYQTLFGVPVVALGVVAPIVAAGTLWRWPERALARGLAWLVAGGALGFLALSWKLRLVCPNCLTVHALLLAAVLSLWRAPPPWSARLLLLLLGGGGLLGLVRLDQARFETPRSGPMAPAVSQQALPDVVVAADRAIDTELLARADHGRRFGAGTPALLVEVVFSFHCGRCSEEFDPIRGRLEPLLGNGKAQLVYRHLRAKKDPASGELVKLALAAAATGRYVEFADHVFTVRKTVVKEGTGELKGVDKIAALVDRSRNQDAITLAKVKERASGTVVFDREIALLDSAAATFDRLLAVEDERLKQLEAGGELPQVFLTDPTTGEILERLDSKPTIEQVADAVRRRLGR